MTRREASLNHLSRGINTMLNYKTQIVMRKILNIFIAMAAALTMLTSCDEDVEQAITLSGQWQGDFGMYYQVERNGRVYTFDSYDTDIVFYPDYDYATHGYGKQVDYYQYGPFTYQYYYFYWELRNGVLYLNYPYDSELNTAIYDYVMNSSYFSGYFGESSNSFRLYKLADYYNWGYYSGEYSYGPSDYYYDYYGYYTNRSAADKASETDSTSVSGQGADTSDGEWKVVKRGNRFTRDAAKTE